ncbi:MAG: hypothetical protein P1U68_17245 [Verrucomicrobiales bacterium]|nr:hypothetical protein [Verrucomicrobiales bacterium]
MEDRINQLNANPGDWSLRCSIILELYDARRFEEAASLITTAPQIPNNEKNILFAATIIGSHDPQEGLAFLQRYTHSNAETHGIAQQKEAFQASIRQRSITPVPPAQEDFSDFDANSEVTEEQARKPFVPAVVVAEREPDKQDKIRAICIAVGLHLILGIALAYLALNTPPPAPPQVTVSPPPPGAEEALDQRIQDRKRAKDAAAPPEVQLTVSVDAFSEIALPAAIDATDSLAAISLSGNPNSFAMSMSGFGNISNIGSIPAGMKSRCSFSERVKRLRESGGDDRAEAAVKKGLEFLSGQQNKNGSFGTHYEAGVTGLALLAFLGHCETPESARYGDLVIEATLYLMNRARDNKGLITSGKKGHHEAYEHAIATYALCELYSMTKESGKAIPGLDIIIRKAAGIIVEGQTPMGGWPYLGAKTEDMSVSGWNIQALKAAYTTGLQIIGLNRSLDLAVKEYLPKIQDKVGTFKYNPDYAMGEATLTGAALLAFQNWKGMDSPEYDKGLRFLKRKYMNPSPGADYYAPYYNTQVFFIHGGEEWENYNSKFAPKLLDAQNEDGSWLRNGIGGYAPEVTQLTNTTWAILMLEVYYRYLPTTEKVRGAVRR